MTTPRATTAGGSPSMTAAERRTLNAIFHHPASGNVSWIDTLRLLEALGSVDETADAKYSVSINGRHVILRKPHAKQLVTGELADLRRFLASAGISPKEPFGVSPAVKPASIDVVALIDHHSARLFRVGLSAGQIADTIRPYDPHHFLRHLHHRNELRDGGQRAPEDLTFYDRIAEALREADRIVLLWHGTGMSDASQLFIERLRKHHPGVYARVVAQTKVNTSAMTEAEMLACARRALAPDA